MNNNLTRQTAQNYPEQEIKINNMAVIRGSKVIILNKQLLINEIRNNDHALFLDRIGERLIPSISIMIILIIIFFLFFFWVVFNFTGSISSIIYGIIGASAMTMVYIITRYIDREHWMEQYVINKYSPQKKKRDPK
jgi:hypothetical protein